jgi:hypothetical protein
MQPLVALPPNHEVRHAVRQILYLGAESSGRHHTPLLMSQKVVQLLYKTSQQLTREVYVVILDQLCRTLKALQRKLSRGLSMPMTRFVLHVFLPVSVSIRSCAAKTECPGDSHRLQWFDQCYSARPTAREILV